MSDKNPKSSTANMFSAELKPEPPTELTTLEKLKKWTKILERVDDESDESWQKVNQHLMRYPIINLESLIIPENEKMNVVNNLAIIFQHDPHIKEVNLSGTTFTSEQLKQLALSLENGTNGAKDNIETLILKKCNSIEIIPLLDVIQTSRSLTTLDLRGTISIAQLNERTTGILEGTPLSHLLNSLQSNCANVLMDDNVKCEMDKKKDNTAPTLDSFQSEHLKRPKK